MLGAYINITDSVFDHVSSCGAIFRDLFKYYYLTYEEDLFLSVVQSYIEKLNGYLEAFYYTDSIS